MPGSRVLKLASNRLLSPRVLPRARGACEPGPTGCSCHEDRCLWLLNNTTTTSRQTGHRPDVCPNPTVHACNTCNHPNPEAGHTCVPKCALSGGAHLTAAKDCNNKLKRIRPRVKPASTTAPETQRHPRPRWFSSEREDSDSDYSESSMTCRSRSGSSPKSRSRSCSRPRPHFRSPRRRSQSTSKQQQQGTPIIAAPKDKGSQQNQRKTKAASPKRTNTKEQEATCLPCRRSTVGAFPSRVDRFPV
ncbi:hypothetical protein HPB49_006555 [Dermacentor silvarum]|uniref:Uncharacterized protein n=1 Tax=Dermacentor silvarum TaxID=543639 RepID=A0ACB8CVV1_DERSI|nr:hypothetical protein HPB49_006555 [Dermacentor silvarum]